jgi:predicted glycogen debranching enzyme
VVVISTEDTRGRDGIKLFEEERNRRKALVDGFDGTSELKRLALAADQFIVKRGDLKTIIAGYHWFSDWGRDTMISIPGLCLATGRLEDAKNILLAFSKSVSEGMLPNRFPDYGESPEYNTIDATLWFFHAIFKYYQYSKDLVLIETLWPVLKEIIEWHDKGTRYGIHVDSTDGLLSGGQDGVQLTWMDAKVGDWVVTPRKGKPVEINALWYNALAIMDFFARTSGRNEEAAAFKGRAEKVLKSFNALFWNEDAGCLFDCLEGDFRDASIRPNQIYALALPFPLVSKTRGASILKVIKNNLFTTRGLRSLDPQHASYCPVYGGDPWHRDGAYHQGTVWSFLLGPYVDALIFVQGEKGKAEAREVLQESFNHLNEAGVGTVSEIFDAAPPHTPRGCMAQAWGVAEILRSSVEHALFQSFQKK